MSKKLMAFSLAILLIVSLSGIVGAQTPVEPVDLEAISIDYSFPAPDSIRIVAYFMVYYSNSGPGSYSTDVEFRLDANVVSTQPLQINSSGSVCSSDTTCSQVCDIVVSGGQIQYVYCQDWYTWYGPGCDPNDPSGTCTPIVICGCGAQFSAEYNGSYNGEATVTCTIDPQYNVYEADETNNTMAVGPVPATPSTWGAIKALYED